MTLSRSRSQAPEKTLLQVKTIMLTFNSYSKKMLDTFSCETNRTDFRRTVKKLMSVVSWKPSRNSELKQKVEMLMLAYYLYKSAIHVEEISSLNCLELELTKSVELMPDKLLSSNYGKSQNFVQMSLQFYFIDISNRLLECTSQGSQPVKCECPPIFGYILPFDFFGNPLGLLSCCEKNDVHVSHSSQHNADSQVCGSVVKPIGYEAKCGEIPKEVDIQKRVLSELEVADREKHPLLYRSKTEDEDLQVIRKIEDLLAFAFSDKNCISNRKASAKCNPPCSVWCDSRTSFSCYNPDTSSSGFYELYSNEESPLRNIQLHKPLFRSFSMNDAENCVVTAADTNTYCDLHPLLIETSHLKSTMQQKPVRIQNDLDLARPSYFNYGNKKWSTWSLVEAEGSLWQPLPDCTSSGIESKQNKRGRDFRRQNP